MSGCFTTFYRMHLNVADGGSVTDWLQPEWANVRFFRDSFPTTRIGDFPPLVDTRMPATGASSQAAQFRLGSGRMWGVGLFPLGWARFLTVPAAQLANCLVDAERHPAFARFAPLADTLFDEDEDDDAEFERIVAHFRRYMRVSKDEPRIRAVHAALIDPEICSVAALSARAGLSTRTVERLCHRYFGFPPKLLLRRQRFMRSLSNFMLSQGGSWTQALDGNYHDQAHFVREFHAFMGMSPSEYAAAPHPVLSAFMAERQRRWGAAAQTLDPP